MINVLFSARDGLWAEYEQRLPEAFAELELQVRFGRDLPPEEVDYIVYAPNGGLSDFTPFTRLKGVQSLWAGVEKIVGNQTLQVPLARMVDPGLTDGMVEWVVGHVLRHHLEIDADIHRQTGDWKKVPPPLARDRKVTILGLGALGAACARALIALQFDVTGWSRSPRDVIGARCLSGPIGDALDGAEIVVLLLPDTPGTTNVLNAESLARLAKGAVILNPGRGPLIDDEALLDALDTGQVGHATLDTFRIEPLPSAHPYWAHPKVTVTPHIASETRPASAARTAAANIARAARGEQMQYLVDRQSGY
ncbi:2-hydroxyacid dehydrogenase [Pontivivens insulae]|uniref:Glyoxylate/hydroxypyruvate reductase A n=1 Tax=Pontivivens insulae TaxID=1639689 RepID=A0A2R8A7P0_9RHOB|nr:glyoxylate/hydroxypyruvate reductase A [Pontivivens insulae]RED18297.1 glyoxylate/hydroxypyruvate reductase A [Pontivivens insulae]SPF28195.1 Glyoxylate/hydroxypyruvate reductase A [Pontivivens insulae]